MSGVEINPKTNHKWLWISGGLAALAVALGIGVGPVGIYPASLMGLAAAAVALFQHHRASDVPVASTAPKSMVPIIALILLLIHAIFLVVGLVLDSLFLTPLSDQALQIPRLSQTYKDPDGFFELRTPDGWTTEALRGPTEVGVRLRPGDREHYMGVSEMTVRVRRLEKPTKKPKEFLQQMALKFTSDPKRTKNMFTFSTEPTPLIGGDTGLWSTMTVKRFWIPLYQDALFGIKMKQFLCSVSTSGVERHKTLSKVLCLGIFETIHVLPKAAEK